jgi:phosphomevalonate kinase
LKKSIFQNLTTTETINYDLWTNSIRQDNLALEANPSANYNSNISEPFSDTQETPNAEMWQDLTNENKEKSRKKADFDDKSNQNKIKQMMNLNDESEFMEMDHQRLSNTKSLTNKSKVISTKAKFQFAKPNTDVLIEGDEEEEEVNELPEPTSTLHTKRKMHASMEESIDMLDQGVKNKLDKYKF